MEVSTTLLVALMFVTLLSMGIGNAVNTLSVIVEKGEKSGYSRLVIGWLVLLLISYFNMFWHIIDLLSVDKWGFIGFLYMMTGPILIYFATSILIASQSDEEKKTSSVKTRFFSVFMLLQGWIITVDMMLEKSIIENSMVNVVLLLIAFVLMRKEDETIQSYGLIAGLLVITLSMVLRGMGILG
jgi:hypothetical protein